MTRRIPAALLALCLTGCGARPGATMATYGQVGPLAATYGTSLAHVSVQDDQGARPTVTLAKAGSANVATGNRNTGGAVVSDSARAAEDIASNDSPDVVMPGEETDSPGNAGAPTAPVDDSNKPALEAADKNDAAVDHTDAAGRAYTASSTFYSPYDPVYLSPNSYPNIYPGGPAPLPHFTPNSVLLENVPNDAFVELARLGRLRERKAHFMKWLFGYGFPKIAAGTARTMLASGQTVFLAPDGSRLHFARTYQAQTSAAALDALLPQLRADALTAAGQAAREADINDRANVLPAFNSNYDIYQLLVLESVADGYSYNGQPVHRGIITAANLYELSSVRRAIATYWEDHPVCSAAELRQATNRVLGDKFRAIGQEAGSLAEMPATYADARAIPGLRDPRAIANNDRYAHDADVSYNLRVIRAISYDTPLMLSSTLYR